MCVMGDQVQACVWRRRLVGVTSSTAVGSMDDRGDNGDEGIYEVEDLLEYKSIEGKDYFLVKWKGYQETSWEPDENIGKELANLKETAKKGGGKKRKKDKEEKKEKKKKRRKDSSEERKRGSDSDSSAGDEGMAGMMGMMSGMPGMVPGMPPPGMLPTMPGFPPDMPMMMPGMMMAGEPGKGKPMGPMRPMMMPGKGGPMPPWAFEPMKGMPPPMKGGCKGKQAFPGKPGFRPFGEMGASNREALDMQRFAVERKRRLREFVGALHARLQNENPGIPEEKLEQTKEFQEAIGLQLEGHQLPVVTSSELVVTDALWLIWLCNSSGKEKDRQLLMNLARLVKANSTRARQLLMSAFREVWPKHSCQPSGAAVQLFSTLAAVLPRVQERQGDGVLPGPSHEVTSGLPPGSPEYWRDLITQLYTQHNPSKLGDVDTLLTKYRGRERTLYLGICEKYKVPPSFEVTGGPPGMPTMPPPPPGGPPGMMQPPGMMFGGMPGMPGMVPWQDSASGGAPQGQTPGASDEETVKKFRDLICKVYKEHNPDKLHDVDNLLTKYRGREEQVYRGICEKYKVEPDLPAPAAGQADGSAAQAPKNSVERYKVLISEIYAEHNKEKLGEIDEILAKYKGKEKTLYLAVCSKYKITPKLPVKKEKKADGAAAEKAHAEKIAKVKPLICEVYQEHNPAKLEDVDTLLAKYKGREEQLYHGICDKYNVTPKIPKSAPPEPTQDANASAPPAEGVSAVDGASNTDAPATTPAEARNSAAPGAPVALRQAYSDLIREVYKEHNPSKLEQVDTLLEKYMGQEQDLYLQICKKYSVKPKDPEGLGDLEWMHTAQEQLSELITSLISVVVLHGSGLKGDDAQRLAQWDAVKPRQPPCQLSHRFELNNLSNIQCEQLLRGLHGESSIRWRKLQDRCVGAEVKAPEYGSQTGGLTVKADGSGDTGRKPFDSAVAHLTEAVSHSIRDCVESEDESLRFERWVLPWSCEEVAYLITDDAMATSSSPSSRKEVAVEYRRGCWTPKKHAPLHSHSLHHSLCGPDVEARLPGLWRELADKLWLGVLGLKWGEDLSSETVVVVEATGGYKAQATKPGMPHGCSSLGPYAAVVATAPTEQELDRARTTLGPVLQRVLEDLQADALFVPNTVCMPQQRLPGRMAAGLGMGAPVVGRMLAADGRDGAASSSSSDDEEAEAESEEVMSDAEPSEGYRPLRLSRAKVRDAYLQGLLCLNCDAADHKHQECPFRKKVCWNCHGNHAGNECPMRCRFCKDRHDYPLLECVKRVCRRVSDWKKSKPAQEQRNVLSTFEQLTIKLEGFEDLDLAKHNQEVQQLVKGLAEQHAIFPGEMNDLAMSILDMKPPNRRPTEPATPPPPPGPPPKPYITPKLPKEAPPIMPENKYPWTEKIFLDSLLTRGMYGSNILSRIIGRGGLHHRRMEGESGARVFFRGLGVSSRDTELTDPIDCRLHISVKGDVPQQGRSVHKIIKEIIAELDSEIAEKGDTGPRLDGPRDFEKHPFGFLISKGSGPDSEEPLKFKFPEEDGQALNDLLVWLKLARLPLELDSDTQWRTTLQVTPTTPPLPDSAPEEAEGVVDAFNDLINNWHYPSPYWFEEDDLQPLGLWTTLATEEDSGKKGPILLQQGQGVRLSSSAVSHFSKLMAQSEVASYAQDMVMEVLSRLRGVVRRQVEDEQLLLYLAYPWAWFAESMGRGLKLPFGKEKVHSMLVDLGRIGGKPTEPCARPAFRGFFVEWMPLKGAPRAEGEKKPALEAPPALPPLQPLPAPQQQWPTQQPASTPAPPPAAAAATTATPQTAVPPKGFCKYWLPEAVFVSGQDLKELIAGPAGSHFAHVLKKYPSVELRIEGQRSTAAPPAHRIHVVMSCEDSEVFEGAAADVLDLVETVCDMVGEELGMSEDQVDGLIREIRAEKYFEAHGIRTPLPPTTRPAKPEPAPAPVVQAPAVPVAAAQEAPPPVAAPPVVERPAAPEPEFEFVDEDIDMLPTAGGDDTEPEDDAQTEASDLLSDITEEDKEAKANLDDL